MANYYSSTLQKGSKGDETKRWQEFLNTQGYGLTVDGDFGDKTLAATRDYQTKNGLTVDGIVGSNTWGKAGYTLSPSSTPYSGYTPFDPGTYIEGDESIAAKEQAKAADDAVANFGDFSFINQDKLDDYISKKENRDPFSYDFNTDALYQQYKDKYIQQGKMAMADTMGQAAAMTGGYGNSYAQSVGQQAYQASLDKLNDVIPELYQLAYDKYKQEGQDINEMISMLMGERDFAYGKHTDELNALLADRGYYRGVADNVSAEDYNRWLNEVGIKQTEHTNSENMKYQTHRDAIADEQWEKGYGLSERELALKEAAFELEKNSYTASTGGGQKGTTPSGSKYDNGSLTTEQIKALQKAVGANDDGYWGANSTKAAGGLSADEAWKVYQSEINKVKGWDDYDDEKLQANQAEKGGSYYSTARSDVDQMIAKGTSYNDLMSYAQEMVGNSLLTKSEYMTLVQYIRNKRESSSSSSNGGSRGRR